MCLCSSSRSWRGPLPFQCHDQRVPNDMSQWLGQSVEDALVHFRILTAHQKRNLFTARWPTSRTKRGTVNNCSTGTIRTCIAERCKSVKDARLVSDDISKPIPQRILGKSRFEIGQKLLHHRPADDKLTDQIKPDPGEWNQPAAPCPGAAAQEQTWIGVRQSQL